MAFKEAAGPVECGMRDFSSASAQKFPNFPVTNTDNITIVWREVCALSMTMMMFHSI